MPSGTAAPNPSSTSTIAATCSNSLGDLQPAADEQHDQRSRRRQRHHLRRRRRAHLPEQQRESGDRREARRRSSGAAGRGRSDPSSTPARSATPSRPAPWPAGPSPSSRSASHDDRMAGPRAHGRATAASPRATPLPAAAGNWARSARGIRRQQPPATTAAASLAFQLSSLSIARPSITAPPTAASLSQTGDSASHTGMAVGVGGEQQEARAGRRRPATPA